MAITEYTTTATTGSPFTVPLSDDSPTLIQIYEEVVDIGLSDLVIHYPLTSPSQPGSDNISGLTKGWLRHNAHIGEDTGKTALILDGQMLTSISPYNYGAPYPAGASVLSTSHNYGGSGGIGTSTDYLLYDANNTLTFSSWAKMDNNWGTLFAVNWRAGHLGHMHYLRIHGDGTRSLTSKWIEAGSNSTYQFQTDLPANHDFTQWHHYVVTKNGYEWKHFLDGVLVGSHTHVGYSSGIDIHEQNAEGFRCSVIGAQPAPNPTSLGSTSAPQWIKSHECGYYDIFQGAITDVRLYNRDLNITGSRNHVLHLLWLDRRRRSNPNRRLSHLSRRISYNCHSTARKRLSTCKTFYL